MATLRHLAVHPHRTRHGDSGGRLRPVPPLTTQQMAPSPAHRLSPPRMAEAGDVPKRWVAPTPAPLREKRPRRAEPESHPQLGLPRVGGAWGSTATGVSAPGLRRGLRKPMTGTGVDAQVARAPQATGPARERGTEHRRWDSREQRPVSASGAALPRRRATRRR
jgi:hypothetical protein